MTYKTIEYSTQYDESGYWEVYEWSTWESGILKGREKKRYISDYPSLEEAKKAHPDASSGGLVREPHVNGSDVPDEQMSAREEEDYFLGPQKP